MESFKDRSRLQPMPMIPAARWVREWVPQDVVATGGRCYLLKWVTEDKLHALREKSKELELSEQKPEPTSEILFLCTYDGCGKTFAEAGALRKHTHIHGERQYVCPVEGCGKKFLDSSKLKRHNLIHTGEKSHYCPYEGCGKAFSLDFNLRAHIKTHSAENYHVCPYPECGKKYTHECKLKAHMKTHHETLNVLQNATVKVRSQPEKLQVVSKVPVISSASSDRPHCCPYVGCKKAYLHVYKLNLHLRKEHPDHFQEGSHKLDGAQDQHTPVAKSSISKHFKRDNKTDLSQKTPPAKVAKQRRGSSPTPVVPNDAWKHRPSKELDEDSEDTEEEEEEGENNRRYLNDIMDDEETEDED